MQDRPAPTPFFTAPLASSSSPLPSVNTRLPYQYPPSNAPSPYSYPDPTFSLPSKSLPTLSRQPSFDFSHLLTQTPFQPLSRQSSLSTSYPASFEEDPFAFLTFDPTDLSFKVDPFDVTRVSSYDSDLSSSTSEWSSVAGEDDSSPRSPQSSVTSLSDSSQSSDAELYANSEDFSPVVSPSFVGREEQWQSHRSQRQQQETPLSHHPIKVEGFSNVGSGSLSSVPILPLPFNQPVYAFNYHSAEEEPTPTSHSSRHERREGLRGGGNTRGSYHPHHSGQETSDNDDSSPEGSYDNSTASTPATASSPSAPFNDISPKSLLLSISTSRTPASSSHSSSSHSSHFSPSSSAALPQSPMENEDPNEVVIGIYTRAERAAKIARYREKRANRQWKKKIMYGCRKSFADNRPRVGGRFIKMKGGEQEKQSRGK